MTGLRIELLPASEGDCLLITYADTAAGRNRHVLVDGGRAGTWARLRSRLETLPMNEREIELLVVTHVDRDHIEGVLSILEDANCPVTFKDIWFNGYRHLVEDESYGPVQGERLTEALLKRKWNVAFSGKAVCISASGALPEHHLEGGLRLTVVSPNRERLAALVPKWTDECAAAGLDPAAAAWEGLPGDEVFGPVDVEAEASTPFKPDTTTPNGSSIGLIAEYNNKRILLAADAHADVLAGSLARFGAGKRVKLAAWKVAHHGSAANTSRELLELVECPVYLISTSGAYFKHPNRATIARIIKYGRPSALLFNYRSKYTSPWGDASLSQEWAYEAIYPAQDGDGVEIDL
ncbi:MAG: MBL fold metallo-hydrolase [Myxococcota bacterium]